MKHFLSVLVIYLFLPGLLDGQDKKPEKKDLPKVLVALPLGVPASATSTVTLRGLKLDQATEVRIHDPKARAKLVSKGKTAVPNQQDAGRVGDTQLVVELTLPPDAVGAVPLSAVTAGGESVAYRLLINGDLPLVTEKEPNNGFRQAQPVERNKEYEGVVAQPQDVDVFRLEGKAGERFAFAITAARHGSALDSVLTLYDAAGQVVASNDDMSDGSDSHLEVVLPRTGAYFLSVVDAHDQGGPVHVYRLSIR